MGNKEREYLMYLVPKLSDDQVHRIVMSLQKQKPSAECGEKNHAAYDKLMHVIGCDQAKTEIRSMIASYRMYRIAEQRSRGMERPRFHAVFEGNPGSNKTTCARLYAKILFEEGIVRKDVFAELSRASLCGRYQGETAQKVHQLFETYSGGVLFIDEAYSLDDPGNGQLTYGREAVNELIVGLEKHPETVVIMAGYPREMENFLDSNPGLRSRVPYKVEFKDYTVEELVRITHRIAQEKGYTVDNGADNHLRQLFQEERSSENFANGRYCRNLVEHAIGSKCEELGILDAEGCPGDYSHLSDEELFSLHKGNFPAHGARRAARTIGFCPSPL